MSRAACEVKSSALAPSLIDTLSPTSTSFGNKVDTLLIWLFDLTPYHWCRRDCCSPCNSVRTCLQSPLSIVLSGSGQSELACLSQLRQSAPATTICPMTMSKHARVSPFAMQRRLRSQRTYIHQLTTILDPVSLEE